MSVVFLVQSVSTSTFRGLAKGICSACSFDYFAVVSTYFACTSKLDAVNYCRKKNREQDFLRFFVHAVYCY